MSKAITFETKGDFKFTMRFLKKISSVAFYKKLEQYAKEGVEALANATPKKTGDLSQRYSYEIDVGIDSTTITWHNDKMINGQSLVLMLNYGHGTRNGGWVNGLNFVDPAMAPVFEKMAENLWKEAIS
jgi:hypothetical protein